LTQAGQFYNGALSEPAVLEKLEGFGITKEQLQDGLALVEANQPQLLEALDVGVPS
jgi:hypothetical protein